MAGYAVNPPSIVRLLPVTKPASGPARYATGAAISPVTSRRGNAMKPRQPTTQPYHRWLGAPPSSRYAIFMRLT